MKQRNRSLTIQRRSFARAQFDSRPLETRAEEQEGQTIVTGRSCVFGVWYPVRDWLGEYQERIDAGAFDKSLRENPDVVCCFNHNLDYPLATHRGKTLESLTDEQALSYRATVDMDSPNTQTAVSSIRRGDTWGSSIAFQIVRDVWDWNRETDEETVTILEARLFEHGPVLTPASPFTTAEVERSDDPDEAIRSVAHKLRRGRELTGYDLSVLNRNTQQINELIRGFEPAAPADHEEPVADEVLASFARHLAARRSVIAKTFEGENL